MKPILGFLLIICLVGCGKDTPTGPQGLPVQGNYENGQIKSEGNLKDGERDGKWVWYDQHGQLSSEGNYKAGEKDGKWVGYDEAGHLNTEGKFYDGLVVGKWVRGDMK